MSKLCNKRGLHRNLVLWLHEETEIEWDNAVTTAAKAYGIQKGIAVKDIDWLIRRDVIEQRGDKIALSSEGRSIVRDFIEFLAGYQDIADWTA